MKLCSTQSGLGRTLHFGNWYAAVAAEEHVVTKQGIAAGTWAVPCRRMEPHVDRTETTGRRHVPITQAQDRQYCQLGKLGLAAWSGYSHCQTTSVRNMAACNFSLRRERMPCFSHSALRGGLCRLCPTVDSFAFRCSVRTVAACDLPSGGIQCLLP